VEEDTVPLSDHEQRLLEQMERALYAEDPKFASALRGSDLRRLHRRRVLKAAVGVFAGIALLLTGVIIQLVPLGVLGSVVMILSALLAVHSWRQIPGADGPTPATPGRGAATPRGRAARGGRPIMQRIEDRWNRRREGNGF
jgi:hypothetical protein